MFDYWIRYNTKLQWLTRLIANVNFKSSLFLLGLVYVITDNHEN